MDAQGALAQIAQIARDAQKACDAENCNGCPALVSTDRDPDLCIFDDILDTIKLAKSQAERAAEDEEED